MKKLLFILLSIFLTSGIWSFGQDVSPLPSITVKKLVSPNVPVMYYNTADSAFWVFKGETGWLRLATNSQLLRYYVPYNNALRDVNLGNRNIASTQQNLPINVGVVVMPTHVKNGDGTITLGSNGTYNFAKSADGSTGIAQKIVVSGTTITLTDQSVNFVYVDYNGGNPVYATSLDNMIFKDDFTKVPVIRATREGTAVHFEEYDLYGLLLANKLMVKDVYLNGGRRLSGLILSTAATRISTISAGSSVFAVQYYDNMAANIAGTAGSLYEYYLSSGVWNRSLVTSYDAIYYSDGTNRQLLGNNKWVAKYYFRDIGDDNEAYYVHGHEQGNKSDAINELIPAVPPIMAAHSVYVGKIVIEKNALNGTAYPRVWEGAVQNEGTSDHSDLSAESLVWGNSGHTGTVNNLASFDGTGVASYTPNNSTNWNTAYTHSQNDTDLSPTNEANTSLTYNQTTRVLSVTDPIATRSATLPLATTTVDGLMSKTDKTKLDAVPSSIDSLFTLQFDSIKIEYGYLYNWYAATDVRNIANIGWHLSTYEEWQTLQTYLGGAAIAGGKLKQTEFSYWNTPNTGATNETNFNARGTGRRDESSAFSTLNQTGYWYSYLSSSPSTAYHWTMYYNNDDVQGGGTINSKNGIAVRLVKDATSLTHGQTGVYVGNDGRIYRTICIGAQEWLADNLAETKYRNSDLIPIVTDNTAWAALTTGAMCSYNNIESNALAPISRDITINDTIYFDKTILGNSSQLEPLRVDTTIIATKHYVDSSSGSNVQDTIVDGVTTIAPSQNAVYDALANKVSKVTSTDNAITRFDGTGGNIQNSGAYLFDSGNFYVGSNTENSYSRMLVYGGANGANLDVMGEPGIGKDQGTVELSGSDYASTQKSLLLQYKGAGQPGTTMGYSNSNLALMGMNGDNNLLYTILDKPLIFGIDSQKAGMFDIDRKLVLDSLASSSSSIVTASTTGKLNKATFTTTGNSGAATFSLNNLNIPNYTLAGLGGEPKLNGAGFVKASGTTISYDNSTYEPAFSKNTAFNKNFGTTTGTVLEGRTFGTAANNNTGDFIFASPGAEQSASIWVSGGITTDGILTLNNSLISNTTNSNFIKADLSIGYSTYQGYMLAVNGSAKFNGDVNSVYSYQLNNTPLILDWLKSGSAPTTTQVLVGGGTTSSPVGITGTEGQVLKIDGGVPKFVTDSGGGLSEDPYIAPSNSSYTLDRSTYIHSSSSTNTNITITLSNLGNGNSGNIEVKYTGAAVVTFVVDSSYTINMADNIWNTTTTAYIKSVTVMSSGTATYSYYRSGNNVKIHGTQYYQ